MPEGLASFGLNLPYLDASVNLDANEHRKLLAACRQKAVEKAVTLLTGHIEAAGQKLAAYLRQT